MNRSVFFALVLALSGGTIVARAQQAQQERTFPVTLTERQWLYIGSLLDEQKVKDAGPVTMEIQRQLGQYLQQQAQAQQNANEKAIRDRLAADAAKAAEDKAKADGAAK